MLYHSLTDRTLTRSFADAVVEGLAPDKGCTTPSGFHRCQRTFGFLRKT